MVSFDVVSLYTKLPRNKALKVISNLVYHDTLGLIKICLETTFSSYKGDFYEQVHGVAMGSPLSPIVANLYMEWFETKALDSFPLKLERWDKYVDDTNMNWSHGEDSVEVFHKHNSIDDSIQFTKEIEHDSKIPFLDVLLYKKG